MADPAKAAVYKAKRKSYMRSISKEKIREYRRREKVALSLDPERRARRAVSDSLCKARYRLERGGRERDVENSKRKIRNRETWPQHAINHLRCRAKKLGLPFDLVADDIVIPAACPVFKIPFKFGVSAKDWWGPSVDRIIPSKGYTKGNIRVISFRANTLKRDCVCGEELRKVADYIDESVNDHDI